VVEIYKLFVNLVKLDVGLVAFIVNAACILSDLVVLVIGFEGIYLGQHFLALAFYFFTVDHEAIFLGFFVVLAFDFEFVEQILFICQRSQLYLLHF
jgi:hypothetical protein